MGSPLTPGISGSSKKEFDAREIMAEQRNKKVQTKEADEVANMAAMHHGGIVEKDGPYLLKKGEKVIPADSGEFNIIGGYGTPCAHYAADGPYHCEDCIFVTDEKEVTGECTHPKVIEDAINGHLKLLPSGRAEVNLENGCCGEVLPRVAAKRLARISNASAAVEGFSGGS